VANLECLCEYDPYLHEFDRHPQGIAIHCGKAYIAARAAGLVVADVSTPDKPVTLGRLEPDSESVNGVAVAPHHGRVYALLASQAQWEVIDVTEPASFKPVWKEDIDTFGPWDVAADGCRALLALGSKGVRALNIANPMAPVTLATVEDIGHTWSVAMRGPLGLAASDEALFTIDIRDISRPRVLGRIDVGGAAKKVWRVGAYAYVYCGSDALAVVDISNPSQMVLLGDCNPENRMHGAVFQAGYAWVADVDSGVKVFKVVVTDEPWDFQSRQSPPLGLKYPRSGD
jgi:hypothetical protein